MTKWPTFMPISQILQWLIFSYLTILIPCMPTFYGPTFLVPSSSILTDHREGYRWPVPSFLIIDNLNSMVCDILLDWDVTSKWPIHCHWLPYHMVTDRITRFLQSWFWPCGILDDQYVVIIHISRPRCWDFHNLQLLTSIPCFTATNSAPETSISMTVCFFQYQLIGLVLI